MRPIANIRGRAATRALACLTMLAGACATAAIAQTGDDDAVIDLSPTDAGESVRDLRPLTRTPPVYPVNALRNGGAASCSVRLDVTPGGAPINVCAECATSFPEGTAPEFARSVAQEFVNSAVASVRTWRYPPAPDARQGVFTVLDYRLDDRTENGLQAPASPECSAEIS